MYQHIPGIDMLRDQTIEYMTIKGCTSVAHQTGRKRALSETYGVSGWQFSFEGQKWIGDYQYIQGINLRCQHLTWYSMKGCRKRDYPPVFNYQTPWWKYNNTVEDYFARIDMRAYRKNTGKQLILCEDLPIPEKLKEIIKKATTPDISSRYQTMREVLLELSQLMEEVYKKEREET